MKKEKPAFYVIFSYPKEFDLKRNNYFHWFDKEQSLFETNERKRTTVLYKN